MCKYDVKEDMEEINSKDQDDGSLSKMQSRIQVVYDSAQKISDCVRDMDSELSKTKDKLKHASFFKNSLLKTISDKVRELSAKSRSYTQELENFKLRRSEVGEDVIYKAEQDILYCELQCALLTGIVSKVESNYEEHFTHLKRDDNPDFERAG